MESSEGINACNNVRKYAYLSICMHVCMYIHTYTHSCTDERKD